MKVNTTSPKNLATLNQDPATGITVDHIITHRRTQQAVKPEASESTERTKISAENRLTNQILREGGGRGVVKFCRELAVLLIRQYAVEDDPNELRKKLAASLTATLSCSEQQAECLIDLSLELIHAKVHGNYRRTNLELSYLIAMASGAVEDVGSN